jgi:flagellar basal-body rod protein FlgB
MNIAFYNAYTALQAFQQNINTISNNIANTSTNGYKSSTVNFDDLIYTQMDVNNKSNELMQGHGVKASNIQTNFEQGIFVNTSSPTDFAIVGNGFFAVLNKGQIEFTRDGAFNLSIQNDKAFLVRNDGSYVLDRNQKPIELTKNGDNRDIDAAKDKIAVFQFNHPEGLIKTSNTSYLVSENSGNPTLVSEESTLLIQYCIEQSNVELGPQMVALIEGQKAFQLNSRVLQTADQIEEIINNLR